MSGSKFTPGPWLIADGSFVYALNERGTNVFWAHVQYGWRGKDAEVRVSSEEIEANARLIAAAPDLLEALEDLKRELVLSDVDLDYIESHFRPWLNKAESAVAKARGYLLSPMPIFAKASPMGKE